MKQRRTVPPKLKAIMEHLRDHHGLRRIRCECRQIPCPLCHDFGTLASFEIPISVRCGPDCIFGRGN